MFKVVLKEYVPPDANVRPGGFALATMSTSDGETKLKAPHMIEEYLDRKNNMVVHNFATLLP